MIQETTTKPTTSDPYASRISSDWEAVERQDPVVWGEGTGPLAYDQQDFYASEGYLPYKQLLSPDESSDLLAEANRLADQAQPGDRGVIIEPGSEEVRSVFRVHRNNDKFRAICTDPRIVDVVRHLLGGEVYVHQSRINYKPAFSGKEFFWHSDFETWHVEDGMPRLRAVSVSINLTDNNEFNGPLMLVGGSHELYIRCGGHTPDDHYKHSLKKQEYGVPSREALQMLIERGSGITAPKGGPGSAVMFECNTMHGSVANLSPYPRTNLFVVYNSVENALVEPFGGKRPRPDFLGEREVIPLSQL